MSLAEQLRAIADRLDQAEADKAAALEDLWDIWTVESPAAELAIEEGIALVSKLTGKPPADRLPPGWKPIAAAPGPLGSQVMSKGGPVAPIETRAESGRAAKPATGGLPVRTAPPAAFTCPDCGHLAKNDNGLRIHHGRAHGPQLGAAASRVADRKRLPTNGGGGARSPLIGKAATPPQPVLKHGEEWFLCPRCPEQFRTRDALTGHLQKGHKPVPAAGVRSASSR